MDFNSAFNNYKSGTATEEERQLVEGEIQKSRLIIEYLDNDIMPSPDFNELGDMKKIRHRLRRRSAAIVSVSILLCVAIFLGIFYGIVPALEKVYWDPAETELEIPYTSDLDMTLSAYAELFCPYITINHAAVSRRGFASYDISVSYWNSVRGGSLSYANLTMDKGQLSLPRGFMNFVPANIFENACFPKYPMDTESKEYYYNSLSTLPDYLTIDAAVSFTEDLSIDELIELNEKLQEKNAYLVWVGVRACDESLQMSPLAGMSPFSGGTVREIENEEYPCLEIKGKDRNAENIEEHFKSLLKFSKDRQLMNRSLPYSPFPEYYDNVLSYVEENGIKSYGAYISAPPSVMKELLDSGLASQIWPQDVWIHI